MKLIRFSQVLSIFVCLSAFRASMEIINGIAFLLSCLLIHRDNKRCIRSTKDWEAGRVFRIASLLATFANVFMYIDYLGVHGIYPTGVRIMFRTLLMVILSAGLFTYVYWAAKACFPFVLYVWNH